MTRAEHPREGGDEGEGAAAAAAERLRVEGTGRRAEGGGERGVGGGGGARASARGPTAELRPLLDLPQLLWRVLGTLEKRWPGTGMAIMLEDAITGDLVLRASVGTWPPSAQRRQPKGKGVMGWAMEHGQD